MARMEEAEAQMEMFSPVELGDCDLEAGAMEKIRSDEEAGRYTACRLRKLRRKTYDAARAMLSAGLPLTDIARILGLHFYTVSAVAQSEADFIAKAKESLAKKAFAISTVALEKVAEAMPNISVAKPEDVYKLALAAANLAEKGTLLSGGATARVEHVETKSYDSPEDFERDIYGETLDV